MGYVLKVIAILALLLLPGCYLESEVMLTKPAIPLVKVPEGIGARAAAGQGGITWLEPTGAAKSWQEVGTARIEVEHEITTAQGSLSAVDYAGLAQPAFITVTRSFQISPSAITGQPLSVEAFGTGAKDERWTLYSWQGPEIPQRADRPLVHRWLQVYALYDMDAKRVTTLLTTIRGEVHE